MKLWLIATTLCVSLLHAGLFDKNVEFQQADSDTDRKYPTQKEYLLSYSNILKEVRSSVVNISTEKNLKMRNNYANPLFGDPFFDQFFRGFKNIPQDRIQRALGSGVIVTQGGYIVTNNHVVEGADKIKVSIPGVKKEYDAELIGTDEKSDLAVIKIDAKGLNAITFYDSDKVEIGDIVFAIGNPFGVGETITQGIVSATRRSSVGITEYEDFIQTDAPINPGNSGGALINSAGQLVGINSAIISKSGGNVGIGFAIPSNMAMNIAKSLIDDGKFTRAYLGVNISDVSEDLSSFYNKRSGALVTGVEENTPAAEAGLKRGDLIISVDGKSVESAASLRNRIGAMEPNTSVSIEFIRNKHVSKKQVKLGSAENKSHSSGYGYEYEGLHVEALSDEIRHKLGLSERINGVFVNAVDDDSDAQKAGFNVGDIIVQVENEEIDGIDTFKNALKGISKKRLYIYRRGGVFVAVL